jgi:hypothetical protein
MPSGTKTILAFDDGSTLTTTPGGDLYWILSPDGTATPCSLQQASLCWMRYEDSLLAPPPVQLNEGATGQNLGYVAVPESSHPAGRVVPAGQESSHEYTPWQRELLDKLGLTADDMDPTGAMRKKNKGKKNKD